MRTKRTRPLRHARRLAARAVLSALLLLCGLPRVEADVLPAPTNAFVQTDDGLRVELPPGGELRVENGRGGVSVEVWDEQFVSVSALVEEVAPPRAQGRRAGASRVNGTRGSRNGARSGARGARGSSSRAESPVRIEKAEGLLTIKVARGAQTDTSRVDLRLRIPASARAQIFTNEGTLDVRGLPAQLSAQTISGDINLDIPPPSDASITAHSLNGAVTFRGGAASGPERFVRQKFHARLGAGTRSVSLFSGRGGIDIEARDAGEAASQDEGSQGAARTQARAYQPDGAGSPQAGSSPSAPSQPDVSRQNAAQTGASLTGSLSGSRAPRPPVLIGAGGGAVGTPAKGSDEPEEVGEDDVVRVDTELVTLNVSVVDRASGRGLMNLNEQDFRLYEDGAEQQIAHFEAASAPFDLVLLIDLSGSTGRVTNVIRAAALSFVNAARPQDRIGVVTFASSTNVVSPLTTDRAALRAAITGMQPPNGDTKLYDALDFTLNQLSKESDGTRRRAVVLMSDGLDSTLPNVTGVGSSVPYEELRSRVSEFDGVLYTLWTSTEYEAFSPLDIQPETFDLVHDRMQELAEVGGGTFYEVERLEDLAGAYGRVVADLGTVYSLSYRPTNKTRDGRWRAIRVTLPRHPNAVARGKRGYYAK